MKKVWITLLVLLFVASLGGTGFLLYKNSATQTETFETDSVFFTDIENKTMANGTIEPRHEIEMKSQVPGIIEKLYVEAGEKVKQGQTIAKIQIVPDVIQVSQAEDRLETARINFKNAKQELERQQQLYEKKVISQQEFNNYKLDYNLKKQAVEASENNLELIREGASKNAETVSNLVQSTITGTILDIPVEEGDRVIESNTFNEGTTIAFVADMTDMIFKGKLDESEVGKVKEGMPLTLNVGAIDSEEFEAVLEFISPKGNKEEGATQFEIKAALNENNNLSVLRAGYSANANIVLEKRDSVMAIKEANLHFEEGEPFVYVQKDEQKFEKQNIETGLSDGINIEVKKGLESGQVIRKN